MQDLKEKMFETDLLRQFIHFPEYKEVYIMMKPEFSRFDSLVNREEIVESILAFQDRARAAIAEYYLLKNFGLEDKIQDVRYDILKFKDYEEDFRKNLDQSFYDKMVFHYSDSFEECDTLADKFMHRVLSTQDLLIHYFNNENNKYMQNEIDNFHTLGIILISFFIDNDLLHYMELADRDKTVDRYNDRELLERLSGFANFYLSETEEYNKLYNEIMDKKNRGKQLKKTLKKPNQQ